MKTILKGKIEKPDMSKDYHLPKHLKSKFGLLYDKVKKGTEGFLYSDTDISGFALWYLVKVAEEKCVWLDNKTRMEFLMSQRKETNKHKAMMEIIGEYIRWKENGGEGVRQGTVNHLCNK